MNILSFLKKEYIPLNTIAVSSSALRHNYDYLSNSGVAVAPVLKSNAYGHGLVMTAKILDTFGAPFFCVDSIYEGYELLKAKIKTPILIMGYVSPQNLKVKKLPFSFAVSSKEMLQTIHAYQPHAGIHIFIDTGMHREGVPMDEVPSIIALIQRLKGIHIEGLMSHFAASDQLGDLTKEQVNNFEKAQEMFDKAEIYPAWVHMANSSGILNYENYKDKIGNVARAGIALYGIDPERKNISLHPTLEFTSTLAQIKALKKGESSGYDFSFIASKNMKIGVVAAGYNDGVDRRLSNKGYMKIGQSFCPIVGRVSMNLTMIDVSKVSKCKVGDKVIIYSNRREDKNTLSNAASLIDTIAYDLLVKLTITTKRLLF